MLKSLAILTIGLMFAVAAEVSAGPGNSGANGRAPDELSAAEVSYLIYMREEEKLARDSYLVLEDLWQLAVFANISQSEQQHMDAVKKMIEKYGVRDPVTYEADVGTFVNGDLQALFNDLMMSGAESELSGLNVGGRIEETDMRDIQEAIDATRHFDIKRVYESLLCGSRNHLRSFVRNIELAGATYVATVLTQAEVDEIAYSSMERCGR